MAAASVRIFRLTNRHGQKSLLFQLSCQRTTNQICAPFSTSACSSKPVVVRKILPNEEFWKKNERMQRPMSPHVTIYSFPIVAWMSIANRVTGAAWSMLIAGAGVSVLALPGDLSMYMEALKVLPIWVLAPVKFALVWPLAYHTVNGVRHLVWDSTVAGLNNSGVISSGAAVAGISLVASIAILAYCSS